MYTPIAVTGLRLLSFGFSGHRFENFGQSITVKSRSAPSIRRVLRSGLPQFDHAILFVPDVAKPIFVLNRISTDKRNLCVDEDRNDGVQRSIEKE
jgi:hypothetical protein